MALISLGKLDDDRDLRTCLIGLAAGAVLGGSVSFLAATYIEKNVIGVDQLDPLLANIARIAISVGGLLGGALAADPVGYAISRIPTARERRMRKFLDNTRMPGWQVRARGEYIIAVRPVSDLEQEKIFMNTALGVRRLGLEYMRYTTANDQLGLSPGDPFPRNARVVISYNTEDYSKLSVADRQTIDTLTAMAITRPAHRLIKGWGILGAQKPDQKIVELFGLAKPGRTSARENRP